MRGRRTLLAGLTIAAALAFGATPAMADHHLIKIREWFPGIAAVTNDSFLELQLYSSGQNLVGGHEIYVYPANASSAPPAFELSPAALPPPNAQNQRTILIGGSSGPATRDYTENLDNGDPPYDPAGGAICFVSTEGFGQIDCVEWGSGTTAVSNGAPVLPGGIPDGSSITRRISRRCSTLLEASDDTGDSASDFVETTTPTPRPNSVAPTERACPNTRFTKKPPKETTKRRAKFKFTATPAAASFECKLDRKPFKPCTSPFRKRVKPGKHKFKVLAEDELRPAKHRWKVVKD